MLNVDITQPTRRIGLNRCAVCQLSADALLCHECAEHPEASKQRVLTWLAANVVAANAVLDRWDAIRAPQQAAWDRIEDSRENDPPYTHISKCAEHVKKGNVYGVLLDAHQAYEQALMPLGAERARLERALEVLDQL